MGDIACSFFGGAGLLRGIQKLALAIEHEALLTDRKTRHASHSFCSENRFIVLLHNGRHICFGRFVLEPVLPGEMTDVILYRCEQEDTGTEQRARARFEPYAVEKLLPPLEPSPQFEGHYKDALTGHLWVAYRDGYVQATNDAQVGRKLLLEAIKAYSDALIASYPGTEGGSEKQREATERARVALRKAGVLKR
ncbi:hypothetical protein [Paraburkholderia tropica]|uniref:hypothetical protein n=1 Tax=Paraburkholderia tropica TaxID=92647 RepID=UPI001CC37A98|nr:hypothetical protein [Paraburkholderia tropica]